MKEFSIGVGGDFSELLEGFKKLPAEAQKAGDAIGKGLNEGIEEVNKSFGQLQSQIKALKAVQATLPVDSSEYKKAQNEITELGKQIGELQRKRLAINTDPRSIDALNQKLSGLQSELNGVAIGSRRFKELQVAIQETQRELQRAGQAVDGFNLIDGAIQGIAFSLTNTVTNAAGMALAAIGKLVNGFAALDTEIRQAAAASGETGAYDKIARSVDQVGIEAAGTTEQVAQLATELIRGGMSVDQMNASLGAIVRGAEATGTGFAEMGSVVSASLKGFGLQAADAQRVVDALVTGANASATSVSGMGMAFKYAAPVARILGVSVEELGIAVGLLTNAGIEASEAGVTLRNGLSKLASAAPQTGGNVQKLTGQAKMAADAMKQLGINIYNADGTLQPMETVLLKLKGAFDKLGPASKIRLAANLFGGEDDGTKWLALLNQSESEIKKMSATMANTKGATDTARNAMQGFQMAMNQLTGTMDSLGKTLGGVAAAALAPLVALANSAIGAVAALPAPVKAVGAALILVAGAATAATAAMVIFQRTMQVTAVQTAVVEVRQLAATMAITLGGAIKNVTAIIPGLLTQLQVIAKLGVGATFEAIGTALKSVVVGGFTAASAAAKQFILYLKSAEFGAFIGNVGRAVAALAPLALAIASVQTWQFVLGGSEQGAEAFADANKKADEAVAKLGDTIKKTAEQARNGRLPSIGIFEDPRNAREQMAQLAASQELTKLQESFTKVQTSAISFYNTLKNSGSITATQATQAADYVEALKKIASAAQETAVSLRQKSEAEKRAGNLELAKQYLIQANALDVDAQASRGLSAALAVQINRSKDAGAATQQQRILTDEQKKAVQERTKAEVELNKIIAEAPVRNLEAQLTIGQSLLGLAKAIGDREQSRFGIVKSRLEYEMKILQDVGAGDAAIAAKRAEIDRVERAALSARYQALLQQQGLEAAMLNMSQQKAQIEADLSVKQQEIELLNAKRELAKLSKDASQEERDAAQSQVSLQQAILGLAQDKSAILAQTQPIERASAVATAEIARNNLQAEAGAKGLQFAANGALAPLRGAAAAISDGSTAADETQKALAAATAPSGAIAEAFVKTGKNAPVAVQGARDFAAYISAAKTFTAETIKLGLDKHMVAVRDATSVAAQQAKVFYEWLKLAAALPAARWSGGPVEAGSDYRVNELGQEALLSAGRLSLINAPQNAIWRAPATGVVVPAGITARLQAAGALPSAGSIATTAGTAELAVEIGKLRQEVGALARRQWNISVTQRTGTSGSQVLRTLQQLR